MLSARTIIGSLLTAALTGAAGFGSALFLQQQETRARLAEQAQQHELELERMRQAAIAQQERDRDLLAMGLYQTWMSEPLATQARIARETLDRHPTLNYAAIRASADITETEREALRAVLRFWMQIEDLSADNSVNSERLVQRLGPDALGWSTYVARLSAGLDERDATNAFAIYANNGVSRIASQEQERARAARLARVPRAPTSGPAL